jgi:hypothetical protein
MPLQQLEVAQMYGYNACFAKELRRFGRIGEKNFSREGTCRRRRRYQYRAGLVSGDIYFKLRAIEEIH